MGVATTGTMASPANGVRSPDDAVTDVLTAVLVDGAAATVVASPPGAGKTYLVELVASSAALLGSMRVVIACQTNAQMLDLAHRATAAYPQLPLWILGRRGFTLPGTLHGAQLATKPTDLPDGPIVVLATAAKLTWLPVDADPFDLLIVDEAWQTTDATFAQIAPSGAQALLVGDPGQIAPVVVSDIRRWRSDPTGPHVAAPDALLRRRPGDVRLVNLPATRRLGDDTTGAVAPTFYPDLPFRSVRPPAAGDFDTTAAGQAAEPLDRITEGQEIVLVEVAGDPHAGVHDPDVARSVAAVARAATRGQAAHGTGPPRPVTVGVACAHVTQVAAVSALLGAGHTIHIDTMDRLQGLEFDVTVVWHPLSGRTEPTEFSRDAGRMCVAVSRHRLGCVVVSRPGTLDTLARAGAGNERVLGIDIDPAYRGWRANVGLLDHLHTTDRIITT